jgi:transcriptional regulator of arginine metabolism
MPAKPQRLTKTRRKHRIAEMLEQYALGSQQDIVELLAEEGVEATQATVSRDLEELGAVKVRVPGGELVYAVPHLANEQHAPEDHLRRVLGEWVLSVEHASNLVVIKTPVGSAHVVASALDRSDVDGVLGTVAGDDTILIVSTDTSGASRVAGKLRALAGL